MHTEIRPLADPQAQATALALLADGQVIAAPTDTVYGVMCRYDSPEAIARVYAVKARPPDKAIPVLIGERGQLDALAVQPLPALAPPLIDRFWPGALTLVLPALPHLPAILTAGQPSLAVRMPDHLGLCALIRRSGPLAATSANLSGAPETHSADEVAAQLDGRLPLILSAPLQTEQPASTIVDLTAAQGPLILRRGGNALAIEAFIAHTLDALC
jgi:L-threonylcarbamoyladenylate synthase